VRPDRNHDKSDDDRLDYDAHNHDYNHDYDHDYDHNDVDDDWNDDHAAVGDHERDGASRRHSRRIACEARGGSSPLIRIALPR
jgi:hypothetical protein